MTEETITITKSEYVRLQRDSRLLAALEAGGVNNWEWYSDSINDNYPEYWSEAERE